MWHAELLHSYGLMHSAAPRALIHTRATILHVTPLPCNNYIFMGQRGCCLPNHQEYYWSYTTGSNRCIHVEHYLSETWIHHARIYIYIYIYIYIFQVDLVGNWLLYSISDEMSSNLTRFLNLFDKFFFWADQDSNPCTSCTCIMVLPC